MCAAIEIGLHMAQRLKSEGETAEFLGILNGWNFFSVRKSDYLTPLAKPLYRLFERVRPMLKMRAVIPGMERSTTFAPLHADSTQPITLFRLVWQPVWRRLDLSLGWRHYSDRVDIVRLPGHLHDRLLREPNVSRNAAILQAKLDSLPSTQKASMTMIDSEMKEAS
jgi:thioesterase domain-containing protein